MRGIEEKKKGKKKRTCLLKRSFPSGQGKKKKK